VASNWQEETISVAGLDTQVFSGGSGEPLLVLHGAGGNPGWMPYCEALAAHFRVIAPSHPGFGASDRPDWMERVHDLAYFYRWFMEDQGLGPLPVVGFSMGGWLAAELAASSPERISCLTLVNAVGLKVEGADIADIFLLTPQELVELAFHDLGQVAERDTLFPANPTPEQIGLRDNSQIMAQLVGWKPYMHNPKLVHRLRRVKSPTMVVWGKQDGLVPLAHGEAYHQAIVGSELKVIDNCGHSPQFERPAEFVTLLEGFLARA
jgi:pimeloyl-ACP methyl ester carboxylesterase